MESGSGARGGGSPAVAAAAAEGTCLTDEERDALRLRSAGVAAALIRGCWCVPQLRPALARLVTKDEPSLPACPLGCQRGS
jgi:hypothetical protein